MKYGIDYNGMYSRSPLRYLRLAEMYLNRAEAAAKLNRDSEALADVNVIRERAELTALSGLSGEVFDSRKKFGPFRQRITEIDSIFIRENPDSYLSPYLMRFMISGRPLPEIEDMYNSLSKKVQNSAYGQEIGETIASLKAGSPGQPAFVFTSTDIDGKPISLSDYQGKYVLIDFWASWCVPCRRGNPHLIELYNRYNDKGFEIVGIADDDRNPDAWRKAVEQDQIHIWRHTLRWLKMTNGQYDHSDDISQHYGVQTLPTKILVDPDGIIVGRYTSGAEADKELDAQLEQIFGL